MDSKCQCGGLFSAHSDQGPCYHSVDCKCTEFREEPKSEDAVVEMVRADMERRHEDYVVRKIREDLLSRSRVGIAKYGVTLEKSNLTLEQFLQHHYEELLDAANYVKGALMVLRGELPRT